MALPDITRISPNKTPGWSNGEPHFVVVHGTRGGANYGVEFTATLNWFSSAASQVSAHWVIARDGTTARCVPDSHRAWHAGVHNTGAIGIELEQPNISDQITDQQYTKLRLIGQTLYSNIPLVHITDVSNSGYIEHMETPQGITAGKSDVGAGFSWTTFLKEGDMAWSAEDKAYLNARLKERHEFLVGYIHKEHLKTQASLAAQPVSIATIRKIVREELNKTVLKDA